MSVEEETALMKYCDSLTAYKRRITKTVTIGDIPMGSGHPIRIQSMTTTDTMDTIGTVEQSIRMIDAGCEYVRITAPSIKEAQNLAEIKKELKARGYTTPLVADIHFTPNAAELAAKIVEKVRVNPGNYADKKKFQVIEYTDHQYQDELDRIRKRFTPLVKICKEYGTAMRIGTNHGSLSDRILSRYGDTPLGMVESAMEFLAICVDENYHNIVLSMKASNPQVMVQAYRLLVNKIDALGWNYPLHLGVTEAGDGEDGRIKSAAGIGTLLEDGLGDTVRVSLTEEPEFEIPVAQDLVNRYIHRDNHKPITQYKGEDTFKLYTPFEYTKRKSSEVANIGGSNVPRVIADVSDKTITEFELLQLGHTYDAGLDKWHMNDNGVDYLYVGDTPTDFMLPNGLKGIINSEKWNADLIGYYPLFNPQEYISTLTKSDYLNIIKLSAADLNDNLITLLKADKTAVLLITTDNAHSMAEQRKLFIDLQSVNCNIPVVISKTYHNLTDDKLMLSASTDIGALMLDGYGDGVMISAENPIKLINNTVFGILQASRTRISKTEYISCPSCGRTLFDLQETTALIRKRTDHLKGVKIGIMGCIVNGPGEMADADYGYVGTGPGKITLYRGQEVVKRNVPSNNAVDELIALIAEDGNWIEKTVI